MAPTPSTPGRPDTALGLDRLLRQQLARVRRRFLVHGVGGWLFILAALVLTYYFADRGLGLPPGVRVVISLGIAAYLVVAMRAKLIYPLTKAFRRDDVAVALERRFPQLEERLISAVQLADMSQPGELRNQSSVMIDKLLEDAAETVRRVPPNELLDPGRTLRIWSLAGGALAAVLVAAMANPQSFGVFFHRVVGLSTPYPRLTTLVVELPDARDEYRIVRDGNRAVVTMAAGDELPVMVRAEGIVPRSVSLVVEGGRGMAPHVAMTARGSARFRHVFRRVNRGFSFHAAGGDDDDGDLQVEVITIQPPRVASVRATLTPPAYTGRDQVTQSGGALEALQGTLVNVHISTTARVSEASLVFLESGREVALASQTMSDDDGTRDILAGQFHIEQSDRYQVRLSSAEGLRNPQPGTYPVVMLTDHAPHGRILSPTDDSLSVVLPNALIALRIEARDDFGLTAVRATVEVAKNAGEGNIDLLPADAPPMASSILGHMFEVQKLPLAGDPPAVGDTITLRAEITDNRQPEPLSTKIPGRPVHVVGHADLARRIAGHFRRVRKSVGRAVDVQVRLHDRLQGVIEQLEAGSSPEELRSDVTVVQVGQARTQSRAARVHLEFMRSFNLHLFNRLEESPHAERVVELFTTYHIEHPQPEPFLPGFYRMLGEERRAGRLGSMPKTLDPILDMTLSCARIAADLGPAAVKTLDGANVAKGSKDLAAALEEGERLQRQILHELRNLQDRLDEWNEFQDVIIQTRSVIDNQRDVQVRTRDTVNPGGKEQKRTRR